MKVLITGGTGFLGQHLMLKLKELEYHISILGRNQSIGKQLESKNVQFLPMDLTDKEAIINACKGQDYVFHCGALSSPWGKYEEFYQANVLGTKNVIEGCKEANVKRLIHVSTSSVYFDFSDRFNITENYPLPKPINAYAKTKQLAEQEINQAYQDGLSVITIRPRGIFGPGDKAILPRLIKVSKTTGIPFINDGKACIDVTYVENVVDALLLCQNAPKTAEGKIFNITNGEPITIAHLLEKLFNKLNYPFKIKPLSYNLTYGVASLLELISKTFLSNKEPLLTRYTVGLLSFSQTLDITAAVQQLGYQPHISIDQGLDQFAQWWQETQEL